MIMTSSLRRMSCQPNPMGNRNPAEAHPDVSELAGVLFGPTGGEGEGAVRRRIARASDRSADQRLDRLLRIAVRLLGASTEPDVRGAIEELSMAARALERWTIRDAKRDRSSMGMGRSRIRPAWGGLAPHPWTRRGIHLTADGMELPSSLEPQARGSPEGAGMGTDRWPAASVT